MHKIFINVVENQFNNDTTRQLERLVRHLYAEHVTNKNITIIWIINPVGQLYTNYAAAQTSMITMACPIGFPQAKREMFLKTLCQDWCQISGQTQHELVLSLLDVDLFNTIAKANQTRFSKSARAVFLWDLVKSCIRSKRRNGFASFNPNK